jgi:hypothetical protein
MSCANREKYRVTVPSKNLTGYINSPPPCINQQIETAKRQICNVPTTKNTCSGTFLPPTTNPLTCLEQCKQIPNLRIDGCLYEKSLFKNGCAKGGCVGCRPEPSSQTNYYDNIPMISNYEIDPSCGPARNFNPPPPPGYLNSNELCDILLYISHKPYFY